MRSRGVFLDTIHICDSLVTWLSPAPKAAYSLMMPLLMRHIFMTRYLVSPLSVRYVHLLCAVCDSFYQYRFYRIYIYIYVRWRGR